MTYTRSWIQIWGMIERNSSSKMHALLSCIDPGKIIWIFLSQQSLRLGQIHDRKELLRGWHANFLHKDILLISWQDCMEDRDADTVLASKCHTPQKMILDSCYLQERFCAKSFNNILICSRAIFFMNFTFTLRIFYAELISFGTQCKSFAAIWNLLTPFLGSFDIDWHRDKISTCLTSVWESF